MIGHILIATDGSAYAWAAACAGLSLARQLSARVTVVRVIPKPTSVIIAGVDMAAVPAALQAEITQAIERDFARIMDEARTCYVECRTVRFEAVQPSAGIIQCAAQVSADLIVMARHGRIKVSAELANETRRVAERSPVPVLIVP